MIKYAVKGRGRGGLMLSALAFHSNDHSSNPAEVNLCKVFAVICCWKRLKKVAGKLVHYQEIY